MQRKFFVRCCIYRLEVVYYLCSLLKKGLNALMDIEAIRSNFFADCFATQVLGAVIEEARPRYARCSFTIEPKHLNAVGTVMGGAIFTLADFAFAVASNTDNSPTVSLSSQISFLGIAKGSKMIAEAECVKEGRSTATYLIHVNDDAGNQVALVTVTGFIKRN